MHRCLELAAKGAGYVAPNPMVGAVLVHNDAIIGEGWHQQYGQAHAEVNCINDAIANGNAQLLSSATIYVSLEPCAHFGKTPPCADLIIKHKIPNVVVGCRDPFPEVDGKGIEKLQSAGIDVTIGILEVDAKKLNKRFFTFHKQHRPYIVLKWAVTADGFIGDPSKRLLISNEYSNRLVHRWRSEEAAILVGTNTALKDDPALTNRLWSGPSPTRLIIDRQLQLPKTLQVFDGAVPTIIFNTIKIEEANNLLYVKLEENPSLLPQLLQSCYKAGIQSILVEGGAQLLQSFINEKKWYEARIINSSIKAGSGIAAPILENAILQDQLEMTGDTINIYKPQL